MERGKLSEIQRDEAWRAQDPADRTAMSALANLNPDEESPEQIAFRKRLEKIKDDDANFAMSNDPDMAANTGRQMTGAGAARAAVAASEQDQRKKDKEAADRAELLAMLEALDQRIAELGEIIGRLDKEILELDRLIASADDVLERLEAGDFDPTDPQDRAQLIDLGIDPDLPPDEIEDILENKRTGWTSTRDAKAGQRSDAQSELEDKTQERDQVRREIKDDRIELETDIQTLNARQEKFNTVKTTDSEVVALDGSENQDVAGYFDTLEEDGLDDIEIDNLKNYEAAADEYDDTDDAHKPSEADARQHADRSALEHEQAQNTPPASGPSPA